MHKGRKFGRKKGQRQAFLKALAHNLIMKEKIITTDARAKEIRPIVERMVTYAKKQQISYLRLLIKKLPKKSAFRLFYSLAPKYKDRKGGYLRIIKISKKRRDAARMSRIEFI